MESSHKDTKARRIENRNMIRRFRRGTQIMGMVRVLGSSGLGVRFFKGARGDLNLSLRQGTDALQNLRTCDVSRKGAKTQRLEKVPGFSFLVLGWLEDLILEP